ncbi:MAG: hypothetical protein A2Y10_16050 [Planctomycetes bacterium GWF2_41_51]|nr:MAG: hypothetical protein A2Y10_16050 [Planctomycetes bacterium GWF2_41_51]HBG25650.1 hypothetical protein [Phycisphaerales bacterium]
MAKIFLFGIVFSLMILSPFCLAETSYIEVTAKNGTGNSKSITTALKRIGEDQRSLLVRRGKWVISEEINIPSNVSLTLEKGASFVIEKEGKLKINGSFEAEGLYQLFDGEGKVKFGDGFLGQVLPQWWGNLDAQDDDTVICQSAIDSGALCVRFPKGKYDIDAVKKGPKTDPNDDNQWYGGLDVASNLTLTFDPGAVIKVIPNDARVYSVVRITGKENVRISGAVIDGERDEHKGTTGEWGHGIAIRGQSKNITIENVMVSGCWGDGIYIGEGCPEDVLVENSKFDNNRRNACSITQGRNVLFKKCTFSNTHGTGPHKGVDIEPNVESDVISNVVFEDCYSYKNLTQGFSLARDDKQNHPVTVTFRGCISEGDGTGFGIDIGPSDTAGVVYISNCVSINAQESGFRCTSANMPLQIDGLYIVNPNQKNEKPVFGSGFVLWCKVPYYKDKDRVKYTGNITARNVNVFSSDGKAHFALYMDNELGDKSGFKNIDIELKTNMPDEKRFYKGNGPFTGYFKINFSDKMDAVGQTNNAVK